MRSASYVSLSDQNLWSRLIYLAPATHAQVLDSVREYDHVEGSEAMPAYEEYGYEEGDNEDREEEGVEEEYNDEGEIANEGGDKMEDTFEGGSEDAEGEEGCEHQVSRRQD